jgi:glycerol-1-phosphate dehydrogenase [NAD(P)+]
MNTYNLPVFMSYGEGLLENLPGELAKNWSQISNKKLLLLSTADLLHKYRREISKIKAELPNLELLNIKESSFEHSIEVAKYICTNDINIVLGFGGGVVLDTSKYAAFVSKVPYIAIPTTLSNDGLASPIAVLYSQNKRKKSFGSKIPDGIIIDTDIIAGAPEIFLKAGIGDTLSNYTSLYDWKLSCTKNGTKVNDFAYLLSETAFNLLLYSQEKSLKSKQCLKMVAQSLVLSGLAMEIAGNSLPCSGSEHLFCHAIDELYDLNIPHGILVALGSIVACKLQCRNYTLLIDYLNHFDISINPLKLGISRDIFVDAWLNAPKTRTERYTVLNEIILSETLFGEIYDNLLVICK